MDFAFITSVSEVRERSKLDIDDRIRQLLAKRRGRPRTDEGSSGDGGSRAYMRANQETAEYMAAREAFKVLLSQELTTQAVADGLAIQAVGVFVNTGREFDKVLVASFKNITKTPSKLEVMYFIQKKTGAIFRAKSPISPNLNHYCGTLYTADKWDWSDDIPVPLNGDLKAAGVREAGFYKPYTHYIPVNAELYKTIFGREIPPIPEMPLDTVPVE